jgi:hypothetical protein
MILFFWGLNGFPDPTGFDWIYFFKSFLDWESWCTPLSLVGGGWAVMFSLALILKSNDGAPGFFQAILCFILLAGIGVFIGGLTGWC